MYDKVYQFVNKLNELGFSPKLIRLNYKEIKLIMDGKEFYLRRIKTGSKKKWKLYVNGRFVDSFPFRKAFRYIIANYVRPDWTYKKIKKVII